MLSRVMLASTLGLSAFLGMAKPIQAEGHAQIGTNQALFEQDISFTSPSSGIFSPNHAIYVDILSVGEVINVSLCGDSDDNDVRIEIYETSPNPIDPTLVPTTGVQVLTESLPDGNVACNNSMTGTLTTPTQYSLTTPGTYEVRLYNDSETITSGNTIINDGDILRRVDVTVTPTTTTPVDPTDEQGRIYAYSWAFNAGSFTADADTNYYIKVPGGRPGENYVWQLDLNDFAGFIYEILANNLGLDTNRGLSADFADDSVAPLYPLYLSPPDPSLVGPRPTLPPDVSRFKFTDDQGVDNSISPGVTSVQDTGEFSFETDVEGTYSIIIDANQDGVYAPGDVYLFGETVVSPGVNSVTWDGRDNNGDVLLPGTYPAQLSVRLGEFHFVAGDAEASGSGVDDGLTVFESISGVLQDTLVFWDDFTLLGETTTLPNGELSSTPAARHTWDFDTGNRRFIDTYVYGTSTVGTSAVIIGTTDDPILRDYGDAPDTGAAAADNTNYVTTEAEGGPNHIITADLAIGTAPDADDGTQQNIAATADNDSGNDEGDITLPLLRSDATSYTVSDIAVTNTTTDPAFLTGWIDFDQSGSFDNDEQVTATVASGGTVATLTWNTIPVDIVEGTTYARFRFSSADGLTSTGGAIDGEVEDYLLTINSPLPPAAAQCEVALVNGSFETPAVNGTPPAPFEVFESNRIAAYLEGDVPGWSSSADDFIELWRTDNTIAGPSLEDDQFAEINAYVAGSLFQDVITTPGTLLTWQFAHRGRTGVDTLNLRIGDSSGTVAQINPVTGTTAFSTDSTDWVQYQGTYLVPAGQTVTRYEYVAVSTANSNDATGNFIDAVRSGPLCDHGDAEASYPVLRADGGAAHVNDGVTFLGSGVNIELDGQPSVLADGDDGITGDGDGSDDEDGVTFTSTLRVGSTVTLDVVSSVAAPLNAWVDFDGDGDWDGTDEQIFTDEALSVGTNSLSFVVPATATAGDTYVRFRLSPQTGIGPTGIVTGGEVEDYQVAIAPLGSTFACDTSAYAVIGTPSSFNIFDPDTLIFSPVVTPSAPTFSSAILVNGMAFNPLDGYLYAQSDDDSLGFAEHDFVRISADGTIDNLGRAELVGSPGTFLDSGSPDNGVIDGSGNYYNLANANTLRVVNIGNTPSAGSLTFETFSVTGLPGTIFDLNFNPVDGFLYGVKNGNLYRISTTGGAASVVTTTGATLPSNAGGSWATSSGISYFYQNGGSGNSLFSVDLAQADAVVDNVGSVMANGKFDATSCTPPAITKDVNVDTALPNGVVTYTYQIFNGFGTAITVDFDDILTDANITFDTGSLSDATPGGGAVTTFTGNQLSIGGISIPTGVGGVTNSVTFTADVDVSATAPVGPIDNQAQVTFGPAMFPSDDPDTGTIDDPTRFEVLASPDVVLAKRITAINRGLTGEQLFDTFYVDVNTTDDNEVNWPGGTAAETAGGGTVESYITGITGGDSATAVSGFTTLPGDTLEYTVSFLSNGGVAAQDVYVCDRIPTNTTFDATAFNGSTAGSGDRGILLSFNTQDVALTNANDGDEILDTPSNDDGIGGYYFPPTVDPSAELGVTINCGGPNDNGAVVVDLSDVPNATGDGTPINAFGYIRFRVVVD